MKRVIAAAAMLLLLAACGEQGLFDGLGERTQEAVYGSTPSTTVLVAVEGTAAPLGARAAADASWFNDAIENQLTGPEGYTIQAVYGRCGESVCQSSRSEIASAQPGIQFPRLLPEPVSWVTSQLVYDVASGLLSTDISAQFGLWQTEPDYTADGVAAQLGVFRVGPVDESDPRGRIVPEVVEQGLSLFWVEGEFHYELFCRPAVGEELCWQMAENLTPLSGLLPEGADVTTG